MASHQCSTSTSTVENENIKSSRNSNTSISSFAQAATLASLLAFELHSSSSSSPAVVQYGKELWKVDTLPCASCTQPWKCPFHQTIVNAKTGEVTKYRKHCSLKSCVLPPVKEWRSPSSEQQHHK
jgi:hypothetical protein